MQLGRQQLMTQVLGPATHVEDPDGVPNSWLQLSPSLAAAAIWGSGPADGRFLFLVLPVTSCLKNT